MSRGWRAWLLAAASALGAGGAWAAAQFFVEAEASDPAPLVQSQLVVTVRFFQGADVRAVTLPAPRAALAEVRPLGAATTREVLRDGRRYRLHERHFAVIPFASGTQHLGGLQAEGRLPGANAIRHWQAPEIVLGVRPVPDGVEAARWLPAWELRLAERWEAADWQVGRVVRRVLSVEAVGVDATQLAEFALAIPGATVVAARPKRTTRIEGRFLVGRLEQDFEILPRRAGPLALPPVDYAWWKVGAGETANARLPAARVEVRNAPDRPSRARP